MHSMTIQRIPFAVDADNRLRTLKARTGITPNILCRLGFCLSLEEPGEPMPMQKEEKSGREINRFTLLGEYDIAYVALLQSWAHSRQMDNLSEDDLNDLFVAHMNRGVELLAARLKGLADLGELVGKL